MFKAVDAGAAYRIFLRLGPNGALGADNLQWIIYRAVSEQPPALDATLTAKDWQPVSYVRSDKDILMRCIREKGVCLSDEARATLEDFPETFDEWKLWKAQASKALEREAMMEGCWRWRQGYVALRSEEAGQ
ncbi:hypothetical protein [Methylocystis suflitae]|uniref:hypothetical protein n=1 Tax=Methylocystis suflitae TaxID=2951405 RepID=UPI00210E9304|nr:hypothetical protein [Methylocystis suflitae]MCQ4188583.1 hypothetical protein [Methylocystis suflitae]